MAYSLITRLLQISPAIPAVVFLAGFVTCDRDGVSEALPAIPEVALVTDIPSHEGRYHASLAPAAESAWDGSEGWRISLRDAKGDVVEGAALAIEAWQPDAMDGAPQITSARPLGAGEYRVDGVALRASGWWNVKLAISGAAADSLAFNVVLR